mgnify:CR=1 FL=1
MLTNFIRMAKLGQRIVRAFENEEHCDVRITLADGTFMCAHSLVLVIGCQYFNTRLNGNWSSGKGNHEVNCSDFSAGLTRSMIKFLYETDIDLSMENVQDILQIADFYIIPDLRKKCEEFLLSSMSCENVFSILNMAFTFTMENVLSSALSFIDNYIENIMSIRENAELFCTFHKDLLILLIKRDSMCIHEEKLFKLVAMWMNSENRTEPVCWNTLVPHIRFGRMSVDFFIENIVYKNVIESDYALKIMLYMSSLSTQKDVINPSAYRSRKCFSHNSLVVNRFFFHSPNNTWESDTINGDRLAFSSNSDVKMQGVILFGAKNCSLSVEITLFSDECIYKLKIREELADVFEFPVLFPTVVEIKKDKIYTIVANVCGNNVFFGIDGVECVKAMSDRNTKATVKFFDSVGSQTNTRRGQIKGLILCLV